MKSGTYLIDEKYTLIRSVFGVLDDKSDNDLSYLIKMSEDMENGYPICIIESQTKVIVWNYEFVEMEECIDHISLFMKNNRDYPIIHYKYMH